MVGTRNILDPWKATSTQPAGYYYMHSASRRLSTFRALQVPFTPDLHQVPVQRTYLLKLQVISLQ